MEHLTPPTSMLAMRYGRYGGPDALRIDEIPTPEPGPGQVRVDLRATAVLPVDWKVRRGDLQNVFPISFPKIPGRDGAGVVSALGAEVDYAKLGDPVCVVARHTEPGTYAQCIVRDHSNIIRLPRNLDFVHGAALVHAGVCAVICLVETAQIQPGMRVLVHGGAGAIGSLAIQLARNVGTFVAATCRAANTDFVYEMGADLAVAYDKDDFTNVSEPFDVVLDLIGGDVHRRSYRVLKKNGHMVCLNAAPFADLSDEYGVRVSVARINETPAVLDSVTALAELGILRPQIALRLPLDQAAEAHRRMEAGEVSRGRIVLDIPPLDR